MNTLYGVWNFQSMYELKAQCVNNYVVEQIAKICCKHALSENLFLL